MKAGSIRVALLSSGLGHVRRGIETWTEDLGSALYERGVKVSVYKGGGFSRTSYETVVPCIHRSSWISQYIINNRPGFLWHAGLGSGYTLEQMTFCCSLIPHLLFKKFHIIHTQDPDVALFCRRLQRFGLIRSRVILAHGTEETFEFLSNFEYVQHLSPFHRDEAAMHGVSNFKAFAIGNFVNPELFRPEQEPTLRSELNIPDSAFAVLSVAAIKKRHKRLDYLINEIASLSDPCLYLIVAGGFEEETDEVINAGKAALGDHAVFLVNFPRERIPLLYASADLFTLCSLKEMMPIALLEALSSGLPCLVHHYPVEEWMLGEGGESLNMSKPGELAQVIIKYRDVQYRMEKSSMARQQAINHFSRDVIVDQVLQMYEEVLRER